MLANIVRLRVLFTVLVVYYHTICPFTIKWNTGTSIFPILACENLGAAFLGNVHMPFFTFVAGYLFCNQFTKYVNIGSLLIVKAKRLLIPYLFWGIVLWGSLDYTWMSFITGISHLWFLLMLFWCFPIGYIFLRNQKWQWWLIICIYLFNMCCSYVPAYLALNNLAVYLPYFMIGILSAKYKHNFFALFKHWRLCGIVLLILLLLIPCVDLKLLPLSQEVYWVLKAGLKLGGRIVIVSLFLVVLLRVFQCPIVKGKNIWLFCNRCSFPVYILHHWLLLLLLQYSSFSIFYAENSWFALVLTVGLILVSIFLYYLLSVFKLKWLL